MGFSRVRSQTVQEDEERRGRAGESDVILIDKSVAVFRCGPDAETYVVGSSDASSSS